jgi:hypothetical protein
MFVFLAALDAGRAQVFHILNAQTAQSIVIYGFKLLGKHLQQLAIFIVLEQLTQLEIHHMLDNMCLQQVESV